MWAVRRGEPTIPYQAGVPVVDEPDVSGGGRRRRPQLPHEAQDLCRERRELAVLDEVAQVEQGHLLRTRGKYQQHSKNERESQVTTKAEIHSSSSVDSQREGAPETARQEAKRRSSREKAEQLVYVRQTKAEHAAVAALTD